MTFDLETWLMLIAAVPAGIGGALLGDRAMGWALARRGERRPDEREKLNEID